MNVLMRYEQNLQQCLNIIRGYDDRHKLVLVAANDMKFAHHLVGWDNIFGAMSSFEGFTEVVHGSFGLKAGTASGPPAFFFLLKGGFHEHQESCFN